LTGKLQFQLLPAIKKANIRIYGVDAYGQSVESFLLQLKTPKLVQLKKKLSASLNAKKPESHEDTDALVKFLQPLSVNILGEKDDQNLKEMLDSLWIVFISDVFDCDSVENSMLETLIENLTKAIANLNEKHTRKSGKRALKAVLRAYRVKNNIEGQTLLGYKYDYQTLKDFSVFQNFNTVLENKADFPESTFANILQTLNGIQHKRPVQLLKMFSRFPDILESLTYIATQLYKEKRIDEKSTEAPKELIYITELLVFYYNYLKNRVLYTKGISDASSPSRLPKE